MKLLQVIEARSHLSATEESAVQIDHCLDGTLDPLELDKDAHSLLADHTLDLSMDELKINVKVGGGLQL